MQIQVPNLNRPALSSGILSSSSSSASTTMSAPATAYLESTANGGNVLIVSAGKKTEIKCHTYGSRPPAEITWWKNSRRLPTSASRTHYGFDVSRSLLTADQSELNTGNQQQQQQMSNITISTLTYIAQPEDDGQRLICRADNIHLEHEEIEDSVTISVRCK